MMEKAFKEKNSGIGSGAGARNALTGSGFISAHIKYFKLLNIYISLFSEKEAIDTRVSPTFYEPSIKKSLYLSRANLRGKEEVWTKNEEIEEVKDCQSKCQSTNVMHKFLFSLSICNLKTSPKLDNNKITKTLFLLSETIRIEMARTGVFNELQESMIMEHDHTFRELPGTGGGEVEETSLKLSLSSISDASDTRMDVVAEGPMLEAKAPLPKHPGTPKAIPTKKVSPKATAKGKNGKRGATSSTPQGSTPVRKDPSKKRPLKKPETWLAGAKHAPKQTPPSALEPRGEKDKHPKTDGDLPDPASRQPTGPGTGPASSGDGPSDGRSPANQRKRPYKPTYAEVCQRDLVCLVREKGGRALTGDDMVDFQSWLMTTSMDLDKINELRVRQGGYRDGGIWIALESELGVDLLKANIHSLPPIQEGDIGFVAYGPGEAPFETFWAETTDKYLLSASRKPDFFSRYIKGANRELYEGGVTGEVRILESRPLAKPRKGPGFLLKLQVDKELLPNLKKLDYKLIYGIGTIHLSNTADYKGARNRRSRPSPGDRTQGAGKEQNREEAMDTDGEVEVLGPDGNELSPAANASEAGGLKQ